MSASSGHLEIVKLLLDHGASRDVLSVRRYNTRALKIMLPNSKIIAREKSELHLILPLKEDTHL